MAWCQQMRMCWVFLTVVEFHEYIWAQKMILSFVLGHVTYSSKCFVQSKSFHITKQSKSSYNLISPGHKNISSLKHPFRWICTISQPLLFIQNVLFSFSWFILTNHGKTPSDKYLGDGTNTLFTLPNGRISSPQFRMPTLPKSICTQECIGVHRSNKKNISLLSQNDRNQSSLETKDSSRILKFSDSKSKLRFQGSTSWRSFESLEWYMIKLYSFSTFKISWFKPIWYQYVVISSRSELPQNSTNLPDRLCFMLLHGPFIYTTNESLYNVYLNTLFW